MVEVKTNGSNMVYLGSPWQININGQDYLQFSLDFLKGLDAIIRELGLPYGQTMAMYCDMDSVIEKAYQ